MLSSMKIIPCPRKQCRNVFLVSLSQHHFVILCKDQLASHEILPFSGLMECTYTGEGKGMCVCVCWFLNQVAMNICEYKIAHYSFIDSECVQRIG